MKNATVHWYGKQGCRKGRKMGHLNLVGSYEEVDKGLRVLMELEGVSAELLPSQIELSGAPLVGIVMGSQSDLPTMFAAIEILREFGVPHEVDIISAHRTPDKLVEYARGAVERGLRVIVAGAGGAAHLPGMLVAMTPLPVVGVPVKTSTLSGVDSLYSIVQMPRGVPVATVAIGNSTNAGLLAVRILAASDVDLRKTMETYQTKMEATVNAMSSKLHALGSDSFLDQLSHKAKSVNLDEK